LYDRSDTTWLFRFYSGDALSDIGASLFRSGMAISTRIRDAGLPRRPRGNFNAPVREQWLQRPDIVALRNKYRPREAA